MRALNTILLKEYRKTNLAEKMSFWMFKKLVKHLAGIQPIEKLSTAERYALQVNEAILKKIIEGRMS